MLQRPRPALQAFVILLAFGRRTSPTPKAFGPLGKSGLSSLQEAGCASGEGLAWQLLFLPGPGQKTRYKYTLLLAPFSVTRTQINHLHILKVFFAEVQHASLVIGTDRESGQYKNILLQRRHEADAEGREGASGIVRAEPRQSARPGRESLLVGRKK